jgi:hypothetical protein
LGIFLLADKDRSGYSIALPWYGQLCLKRTIRFDLALKAVNQSLALYRPTENRRQEANCLRLLSSISRKSDREGRASRDCTPEAMRPRG